MIYLYQLNVLTPNNQNIKTKNLNSVIIVFFIYQLLL